MLSLEFEVKVDIVWQLQECHFCRTLMIFYTTKTEVSKSSMHSPPARHALFAGRERICYRGCAWGRV